jgi:hypothetical protein
MEADVEGLIGAGRHERNGERTTWSNAEPAGAEAQAGELLPGLPRGPRDLGR